MKNKGKPPALWAVCFWIILWQLVAMAVDQPIFLASPWQVLKSFVALLQGRRFYISILNSTGHVVLGILLATLLGVALGGLSSRFSLCEELLAPLMNAIKSVPVVSYVILALICFSSRRISILITFLVVLPVLYANLLTALKEVDPKLKEMARVYEMRPLDRLRYVTVPQVYPIFQTALRLSCGMAWKAGVAAEVIGSSLGTIGERIGQTKLYLETAELFAWTGSILVLSALTERLGVWLLKYLYSRSQRVNLKSRGRKRRETQQKAGIHPVGKRRGQCEGQKDGIRITGLGKTYGEKAVLRDYDALFQRDEPFVLMAPSGSGKTTLLRILAGLEKPDTGEIQGLGGKRVRLMFQENRLLPGLDALANLAVANPQADPGELRELLSRVGLTDRLGIPVSKLSGGEKRRVSLLRALSSPGDVLLLDEPFTGVDEERKESLLALTRERAQGRILVVASHEIKEARALGAKVDGLAE